jgi:hypothetical protein
VWFAPTLHLTSAKNGVPAKTLHQILGLDHFYSALKNSGHTLKVSVNYGVCPQLCKA